VFQVIGNASRENLGSFYQRFVPDETSKNRYILLYFVRYKFVSFFLFNLAFLHSAKYKVACRLAVWKFRTNFAADLQLRCKSAEF
jgi:hypothetical protein